MEWGDKVVAVVAVYGAILSTWNLYDQRRRRAPRIKVQFSIDLCDEEHNKSGQSGITIAAQNHGEYPVTLSSVGILVPRRQTPISFSPPSTPTFPVELSPGRQIKAWIPVMDLAKELQSRGLRGRVALRAVIYDQLGNCFRSKKIAYRASN